MTEPTIRQFGGYMRWHGEHEGLKFYLHDETGIWFPDWPTKGAYTCYDMDHETIHALWMWIENERLQARKDALQQVIDAAEMTFRSDIINPVLDIVEPLLQNHEQQAKATST